MTGIPEWADDLAHDIARRTVVDEERAGRSGWDAHVEERVLDACADAMTERLPDDLYCWECSSDPSLTLWAIEHQAAVLALVRVAQRVAAGHMSRDELRAPLARLRRCTHPVRVPPVALIPEGVICG